jgi:ribosomal-protein-alanine N-acetyltransferase
MQIIFETARLVLRQFTLDDAPLIYQLNQDPEVVKYVHEPPLTSVEQAEEIIANIIMPQYPNKLGRWSINLKENNAFVGWCGLKYRADLDEIDLGYRLMKSYWGKGIATEAASQTLQYGFQNLNLKTIIGKAHIDNLASIGVLEKIGMNFIANSIEDACPIKIYSATNPQL